MFVLEKGGIVLSLIFTRGACTDITHHDSGACIEGTDRCPNDHITFYFYKRNIQKKHTKISENTINTIEFIPSDTLKILIHGVKGGRDDRFNTSIREAYFLNTDYNIITVVYTPLAPSLKCYGEAIFNMKIIARCTVRLLQEISKTNPHIKYQHIIGFSLGAQIAGTIAKIWKEKMIDKIYRITGLDPAILSFENGRGMLNADSATIVDIIHTNSGFLGEISPIGTVDFYANGGIIQPGCEYDSNPLFCHHHRAYYYFAESINYRKYSCGIFATLSGSRSARDFSLLGGAFQDVHVRVGEYLDLENRGVYYFKTNSVKPFALHVCYIFSQVVEDLQPN